ncbi:MAG: hypothetical protein LBG57_10740 [Treponema sp.]|jgi:hypothetical protein|nr:hypothetical protein [Treponema sp.]
MKNFDLNGRLTGLLGLFLSCLVFSCASIQETAEINATARSHPFTYYFPVVSGTRIFSGYSEAYQWLREAESNFNLNIPQSRGKGLVGKLSPLPPFEEEGAVKVVWFMNAFDNDGSYLGSVSSGEEALPVLKTKAAVSLYFIVSSKSKAVFTNDLYIASGYRFSSNSNMVSFSTDGVRYSIEYPVGWSLKRAFEYLQE